jgi:hypothetical protein
LATKNGPLGRIGRFRLTLDDFDEALPAQAALAT